MDLTGSCALSAATALPPHRYAQERLTDAFAVLVLGPGGDRRLLDRLHAATGVRTRHLALPLEDYPGLADFGAANDAFIRVGLDLGERAIRDALARARLQPEDVDVLVTTSVTGMAAPSLDARLVGRLGLRDDVRRIPVFGLGCVAGAAGLARVNELLRGDPDAVAVLLAVELCSLTVQRDDASTANLVASGLFGDGAAAVVLAGARRAAGRPGPRILASRSRLYPDSERVMGWDIGASGLRIVLDASVADVVERYVGDDVKRFLADHDLAIPDVVTWLTHPGGPKVLRALAATLGLPDSALSRAWESLAAVGNLSSASVLHVLEAAFDDPPPPGSPGLLLAMGPGFCSEQVLLRW